MLCSARNAQLEARGQQCDYRLPTWTSLVYKHVKSIRVPPPKSNQRYRRSCLSAFALTLTLTLTPPRTGQYGVEAERGEKPRIRQKGRSASRHIDWLTANKSASQPTSRSKSSKSSIERPSAVRIKGPSEVESAPRNVTAATRDHRFKLPRRREAKCSALKYYRTCGSESSLPPRARVPLPVTVRSPEELLLKCSLVREETSGVAVPSGSACCRYLVV